MRVFPLRRGSLTLWVAVIATLILSFATTTTAQIPDEFTNLKVLHTDISKGELMDHMKSFTRALGVRCEFCHVGQPGQPLSEFDFASDEKEHKLTARVMLTMVEDINSQLLAKLGKDSDHAPTVSCVTCHRGHEEPKTIEQALDAAYAEGGVESVLSTYKDLREQYYGGAGYDFREDALSGYAAGLAQMQKTDDAMRILELNAELHPESAGIQTFMALTLMQSGDNEGAIEHLNKALELDPDDRRAQGMLQRLQGQ